MALSSSSSSTYLQLHQIPIPSHRYTPFPLYCSNSHHQIQSKLSMRCRFSLYCRRSRNLLLPRTKPAALSIMCFSQNQKQSSVEEEEKEELEFVRLFSNLNQVTFKREPGSLTSSILLVAGTTIGAGILAIPAVTQEAGFLASAAACFLCWIFMVVTGLLIAEVNVKTMCELGSGGVSLVSMARRTLGTAGVQIACWLYIFIHYALLVAYVARSSDILANFLSIPIIGVAYGSLFNLLSNARLTKMCTKSVHKMSCHFMIGGRVGPHLCPGVIYTYHPIMRWESATLFSFLLGGLCYFGSQQLIGTVNGALVLGIVVSFTALVVVASGDLHWDALLRANLEAVPRSIPIIALSFVYQNVVPVLCTNLEGNLTKVRTAIVLGTAIPLTLFIIWNGVILGTVTVLETGSDKIADPLQQLQSTNGVVGPIVEVFSFLAIATSYIGFVLGLSDFLADLLKFPSGRNSPLPYLLTLIPPLILSLLDPEIFFKALDFAGTYGVLVLFGIFPAAMSWSDRYSNPSDFPKIPLLVPGGKLTLSLVIGGAGFIILSEVIEKFGHG